MEHVKIVIEVTGGFVSAVNGGAFVEVVVVDHDEGSIKQVDVQPLNSFAPQHYLSYDGGYPRNWGTTKEEIMSSLGV